MERKVDDRTILDKFVEDFVRVVEGYCKYIVVSGFVAIAHGRSRGTEDIDMIIERISKEKFAELHNDLKKAGFEDIGFNQTIFCSLPDIKSIEPIKQGYGEGSFVVIKAKK